MIRKKIWNKIGREILEPLSIKNPHSFYSIHSSFTLKIFTQYVPGTVLATRDMGEQGGKPPKPCLHGVCVLVEGERQIQYIIR